MSSSDSVDAPAPDAERPERHPDQLGEVDPAIAEAVDGVANRFGAQGLEQMLEYAEGALAEARAALAQLAPGDG